MRPSRYIPALFIPGESPDEEASADEQTEEEGDKRIYCSRCGEAVTHTRERITVQGGTEHTFTNAYGYVYRIGCFKKAAGCCAAGSLTGEYTWFSGYSWKYALCVTCRTHLGWYYISGDDSFYGLILDHLIFGPGA